MPVTIKIDAPYDDEYTENTKALKDFTHKRVNASTDVINTGTYRNVFKMYTVLKYTTSKQVHIQQQQENKQIYDLSNQ